MTLVGLVNCSMLIKKKLPPMKAVLAPSLHFLIVKHSKIELEQGDKY